MHQALKSILGNSLEIIDSKPISGGDINNAFWVNTNLGAYFVKHNTKPLDFFQKEINGLIALKETNTIKIPGIYDCYEQSDGIYLVLEFIETAWPREGFWEKFGHQLALLHKTTSKNFGFKEQNYIGALDQFNATCITWTEFFITQRIEPQLKLARLNSGIISKFNHLFKKLEQIIPNEPPALIHGDLWAGNFICDMNNNPVLIDPAVSFNHREADIAMSKLFGGFDSEFYLHYNKYYPMESGWNKRMDIYNLYPLLVHVNLFGESYLNSVISILNDFN